MAMQVAGLKYIGMRNEQSAAYAAQVINHYYLSSDKMFSNGINFTGNWLFNWQAWCVSGSIWSRFIACLRRHG